jgi:hypothetical protein
LRDTAETFGVSHERVRQLVKREQERRDLAWHHGSPTIVKEDTYAVRLEREREAFRLAQYAQALRAERYGMGYREETAAFYGSAKFAASDDAETRLVMPKQLLPGRAERDAWEESKNKDRKTA